MRHPAVRTSLTALALSVLSLLVTACEPTPPAECSPDPVEYETSIRPALDTYCGQCHGAETRFGAPYPLVELDALLVPDAVSGQRPVDRVASAVATGFMPPAVLPRVPHEVAERIAQWASCGATHAMEQTGVVSTAPPFLAPESPPELPYVDLLASDYAVPEGESDTYRCFGFAGVTEEPRFIRRFQMVMDETRVLHHLVVFRVPEGGPEGDWDCFGSMPPDAEYLYAWAPGQGAVELPDGGLRVSREDRFVVQIHYNNRASLPDLRDSSGVRLYLAPTEGTEYGMLAAGPVRFSIPARSTHSESRVCTFRTPTRVVAGMPHMHELGASFEHVVERADGSEEPLIAIDGWDFEAQLFYSLPTQLSVGDRIRTRCTWDNPRDEAVSSGARTDDEMCFGFLYVSPPPTQAYCDEGAMQPVDVTYAPGTCAPAGARVDPPLVRGTFREGAPEPLAGGALSDGRFELVSIDAYASSFETPLGTLDGEGSELLARGQASIAAGALSFDYALSTYLRATSGTEIAQERDVSATVTLGGETSPTTATPTCPPDAMPVTYEHTIDAYGTLVLGFSTMRVPGTTIWTRMRFARVE